jgi:hypothetical protein
VKKFEGIDRDKFIGGWYIPHDICDKLIEWYHDNKKYQVDGVVYNQNFEGGFAIDPSYKESTEIGISHENGDYPINQYRVWQQRVLDAYIREYPDSNNLLDAFNINEAFNLQHYAPTQGFKQLHAERTGVKMSKRVLVFMTYLNDVPGGGTQFPSQSFTAPAEKGLTLIWPAEWTHAHVGQISPTNDKYIITGWYSFNE